VFVRLSLNDGKRWRIYLPGHFIVIFFLRTIIPCIPLGVISAIPVHVIGIVGIPVLGLPFRLTAIKLLVIKFRHEIFFNVIHNLIQGCQKAVEILFIQEDFMALIAKSVVAAGAFCYCYKVVTSTGAAHIHKVSTPLTGAHFFRKYALLLIAIVKPLTPFAETALRTVEAALFLVAVRVVPTVSRIPVPAVKFAEFHNFYV
jgi:hypothetical protein